MYDLKCVSKSDMIQHNPVVCIRGWLTRSEIEVDSTMTEDVRREWARGKL